MMDLTTSLALTAVTVAGGTLAAKKPLTIKLGIGFAGVAVFLTAFQSADPKLAAQFGLLILLVAVFKYGPDLANLLSGKSKPNSGNLNPKVNP